jgi:hypothetical protein
MSPTRRMVNTALSRDSWLERAQPLPWFSPDVLHGQAYSLPMRRLFKEAFSFERRLNRWTGYNPFAQGRYGWPPFEVDADET